VTQPAASVPSVTMTCGLVCSRVSRVRVIGESCGPFESPVAALDPAATSYQRRRSATSAPLARQLAEPGRILLLMRRHGGEASSSLVTGKHQAFVVPHWQRWHPSSQGAPGPGATPCYPGAWYNYLFVRGFFSWLTTLSAYVVAKVVETSAMPG
jgi:hypothetical protein